MPVVFFEPQLKTYKTYIISTSSCFTICLAIISMVFSFFLVFESDSNFFILTSGRE